MSAAAVRIIDGEISKLEGQLSKLRQARDLLAGKSSAAGKQRNSQQLALPAPDRGITHVYTIGGVDIDVTLRQKKFVDVLMKADDYAPNSKLLRIFGGNKQHLYAEVSALNKLLKQAECRAEIQAKRGEGYRLQDLGAES